MDSSPGRSASHPPSPSPSFVIAFPTLEVLPAPPTIDLPSRSRRRSNALLGSTNPPQTEGFTTPARRDSIDSIRSTTSASSGYNAEIERLRAEVAQHDQEVEESAIGLGITRGSTATTGESETFNYRGVQSARQSFALPSRREPLPVAERPPASVRDRRRSQHSRSSSVASLPSTEDLRVFSEPDVYSTLPPLTRQQQKARRPSAQEAFQNLPQLTSATYIPPQLTSATYIPPQLTSATYVPPQLTNATYVPPQARKMNYQGFGDPNQPGQPSNPRQAPPSPGQGMAHTNGMNGQMNMASMANMIGFPTPAGHQSDLNYIMIMVEELSRLLAANQKITDSILEKIGNVRQRAKDKNLSNDELLAIVSEELNAGSENLENENSQLRRAIEQSKADADENWKLVLHAAGILEDIKEKAHNYKFQHEKDTLAWHKSYRDQLAQERKENLELRCHIADMQAHAAKANDYINQLRRYASEHKIITELTTQVHQYKSERRFWKRMACVGLREDPSEWSDDEGGATGDIPEAEKIACASYIAEREEMARIILGKNDEDSS
ncbi:hypothetical protein SBOR_1390 [Sclerotinia borealis F-4128]|uniref:Uncharacterized protein n=1 Tax=Sclerotinia borealis (strain F-4128) TaxID=1432307 RepID=W9CUE7_SCLBF|nr:hypothetical protein SBOR_1390 [Sclerotinia borealis F-4128]